MWLTYGLLVKPTIPMCSVHCVAHGNGIMSQRLFSNNGLQRKIDHRTGTHYILRQQSKCVGIFLIVLLRPSTDEFGKYAIVHDYAVVFNEANRRVYNSYID